MKYLLQNEAILLTAYLRANRNDIVLRERYCKAIAVLQPTLTPKEEALMRTMIRIPFLLPLIDAGSGLLKVNPNIRKRILVMCALIETDKKYVHRFLNNENMALAIPKFIYRGIVAMLQAVCGAVVIIVFRWK